MGTTPPPADVVTAATGEPQVIAAEIIEDTWAIAARANFLTRQGGGLAPLPDIGFDAIAARSRAGAQLIARIDELEVDLLPADVAVSIDTAASLARRWAREEEWYWLVFDPLGVGFFGMFGPSAYCGGFVLNSVNQGLDQVTLTGAGSVQRFGQLIGEYAALVSNLTTRTAGQAERGIILPARQLPSATALVGGLKAVAGTTLRAVLSRSDADAIADVAQVYERRIATEVEPAFDALLAVIADPEYVAAAPEGIGLDSYPGGAEIYPELVKLHTTLDIGVEEVHARGHDRMRRIRQEMEDLIAGAETDASDPHQYLAAMRDDPAWNADTAAGVAEHFQRYIDRLAPELDQHFGVQPRAPYGVEALPEAVSGSMTFGYYAVPEVDRETGLYLFNAVNLTTTPLPMVAALNYHELVPGHHFHMALQREATDLHPLRQNSFVNAFNEGWAEYAARFAGEIGMYRTDEERFGRLIMEAFLTSRLVVDTGMNALGWSLERAREYMRENSFMSATEVDSETLRYSCDLPGQALAYKLGDDFLYDLREDLRTRLGDRFSVSGFHDAVMRYSGLPLPVVARAVTARLCGDANAG